MIDANPIFEFFLNKVIILIVIVISKFSVEMEIPNTPKGISESEKKAPTTTQTNGKKKQSAIFLTALSLRLKNSFPQNIFAVLLTLSDDMKEFVEFLRSPSEEDPKGFVNKFIHRMKNSSEEERDPQSVIEKTLKSEVCWNKLK